MIGASGPDNRGLRHLIEHIQDAVVAFELQDGQPIVRGLNGAFVEVFGYPRETLLNASLNDYIVPDWLTEEAARLDQRTGAGEINYRRVQRQTDTGLREFLYRGVPYDGEAIDGYAVYTDLTEISRTERRLQVFTRVLRHNLRNEATVLTGSLEQVATQLDTEEPPQQLANARAAAEALQTLSHEATAVARLLQKTPPSDAAVDVSSMVRSVVQEFQDQTTATLTAEGPKHAWVAATTDLRHALVALVENAIEHNPASSPTVKISIYPPADSTWVTLHIDDDGPRIPQTERQVVTGETSITPTTHGSGLGLWLAKWTVDQFGGTLDFTESQLGGNRVRIRLPQASPSDANVDSFTD